MPATLGSMSIDMPLAEMFMAVSFQVPTSISAGSGSHELRANNDTKAANIRPKILFFIIEGCFVVVGGVGCASVEVREFKEIREFKEAESLVSPLPKLPKFLLCRSTVDGRQLTLFYSSASSAIVV